MIEFEVNGDFRHTEDICSALEEMICQIRQGYTSGYLGDCSWTSSGDEEDTCTCDDSSEPHYHCLECDCVLEDASELDDPYDRICNDCFKKEEGE